jgi:fructosamine-3-kinase
MTTCAAREVRLDREMAARLERVAARLGDFLPDDPPASLIHGDVWAGNVLSEPGRITAFLDPAPYFAHHEVELAFITMFSTFGDGFFRRYAEIAGTVDREFWEVRRYVYTIFPLLVHVRLFGGSYVGQLDATLGMLGH